MSWSSALLMYKKNSGIVLEYWTFGLQRFHNNLMCRGGFYGLVAIEPHVQQVQYSDHLFFFTFNLITLLSRRQNEPLQYYNTGGASTQETCSARVRAWAWHIRGRRDLYTLHAMLLVMWQLVLFFWHYRKPASTCKVMPECYLNCGSFEMECSSTRLCYADVQVQEWHPLLP